MARRVSMPAADDLFRPTSDADQPAPDQRPRRVRAVADDTDTGPKPVSYTHLTLPTIYSV